MKKLVKAAKRATVAVLAFALLLPLGSCGSSTSTEPTDELVLYLGPGLQNTIAPAAAIFRELYPDVELVIEDYDNGDYDNEDYEEYKSMLQTELSAGSGPDLLVYLSDTFPDLYKTAESGVFANIDDFIAADPDFDLSGYNEAVMELGVHKETRFTAPITYYSQSLVTTKENLEYWGFNITEDSSFEEIASELTAFCKQNQDNTAVNLFLENWGYQLSLLFPWSGVELINYDTGEVTVDTDDFKSVMDLYKAIYPMDWIRSQSSNAYFDYVDILENRVLFSVETNPGSPYRLQASFSSQGQTPVVINLGKEQKVATGGTFAAINNGGENQYNAYLFLKILLGYEYQSTAGTALAIPVLDEAVMPILGHYVDDTEYAPDGLTLEEAKEQFVEESTDVSVMKSFNKETNNILWECMEPYFKDEKDYDSCLAELENKLQLYLNE